MITPLENNENHKHFKNSLPEIQMKIMKIIKEYRNPYKNNKSHENFRNPYENYEIMKIVETH